MRSFKIRNLRRIPGGFAKVLPMIIIIMVVVAVTGTNKTPVTTDNSGSQTQLSEIVIGDTIHGKLDETDMRLNSRQFCDEYSFGGIGGQEIIISLSTFDFDAFLWLLNSEGEVITINDDTGDGIGSIISEFSLPGTGQYTIWVSSYNAGEIGTYTLTLNEAPLIDSPQAVSIGARVKGNLNNSSLQFSTGQFYEAYTFEADYGQAVSIIMGSNKVDTYLWLLNKEGRVITVNDNARDKIKGGNRSQIIFFPPVSDTYIILASSGAPLEKGKFTLSLKTEPCPIKAKHVSKDVSDIPGKLEASDFQLNAGQYLDIYSFSGEMGEIVTLGLSSPDFDSYLTILDHKGNVIKADNNSGFERDALVENLSLPETGKYYVWVSSVFSGDTGEYLLSFNDEMSLTQQEALFKPDIGTVGSIKLIFGKRGTCGGRVGRDVIMGEKKFGFYRSPYLCVGETIPYKAYVEICIGNWDKPVIGHVYLFCERETFPYGKCDITIEEPNPKIFIVDPNNCTTPEPFTITISGASPGKYAITATVVNIGSDTEYLFINICV